MTPGFHDGIPEADYHADRESVSQSGLKTILKSPALFRHQQLNPEPPTDAMVLGTLVHTEVLGVGQGMRVVPPTGRTKAQQEEHKAAKVEAIAAGLVPVTAARAAQVKAMAKAVNDDAVARVLFNGGASEVSAYSPDPETGILRRCRFDKLHEDLGVDLKTTIARDRSEFAKSCANYGYHQQHAFYCDIAAELGQPLRGLVFVTVTNAEPYEVAIYELDNDAVMRGRDLNARAMRIYQHCTETDDWSGVRNIQPLSLPRWAFIDDLEDIA